MNRNLGALFLSVFILAFPALSGAQSIHPLDDVETGSFPKPIETPIPVTPISATHEIRIIESGEYPITLEIADQILEVKAVNAEQALQLLQWEKQNIDAWWRFWFTAIGVVGAVLALIFTGWRTMVFHKQTHEQMLANYRERLFSEEPGSAIAAAMSLSKYPREAIWLVMRWAQEHKKEQPEILDDKTIVFHKKDDPHQVKQAVQDALDNMAEQTRWYFEGFRWPPFKKIKGPRLDKIKISFAIGPIKLRNAYMVEGYFNRIQLCDARLNYAQLQFTKFYHADLAYAHLRKSHLEGAEFGFANLRHTNLSDTRLEGSFLGQTSLENALIDDSFLSYALRQKAILDQNQLERTGQWNNAHPDAPWLQPGWKFWGEYPEKERKQRCKNEIRIVRSYIKRIRKKEPDQ